MGVGREVMFTVVQPVVVPFCCKLASIIAKRQVMLSMGVFVCVCGCVCVCGGGVTVNCVLK